MVYEVTQVNEVFQESERTQLGDELDLTDGEVCEVEEVKIFNSIIQTDKLVLINDVGASEAKGVARVYETPLVLSFSQVDKTEASLNEQVASLDENILDVHEMNIEYENEEKTAVVSRESIVHESLRFDKGIEMENATVEEEILAMDQIIQINEAPLISQSNFYEEVKMRNAFENEISDAEIDLEAELIEIEEPIEEMISVIEKKEELICNLLISEAVKCEECEETHEISGDEERESIETESDSEYEDTQVIYEEFSEEVDATRKDEDNREEESISNAMVVESTKSSNAIQQEEDAYELIKIIKSAAGHELRKKSSNETATENDASDLDENENCRLLEKSIVLETSVLEAFEEPLSFSQVTSNNRKSESEMDISNLKLQIPDQGEEVADKLAAVLSDIERDIEESASRLHSFEPNEEKRQVEEEEERFFALASSSRPQRPTTLSLAVGEVIADKSSTSLEPSEESLENSIILEEETRIVASTSWPLMSSNAEYQVRDSGKVPTSITADRLSDAQKIYTGIPSHKRRFDVSADYPDFSNVESSSMLFGMEDKWNQVQAQDVPGAMIDSHTQMTPPPRREVACSPQPININTKCNVATATDDPIDDLVDSEHESLIKKLIERENSLRSISISTQTIEEQVAPRSYIQSDQTTADKMVRRRHFDC